MNPLLFACLCLAVFGCTQHAPTDNKITIGTIDSLHSNILKENRKIWVYVPDEGSGAVYSKQKYPVIYLLDGDSHFSSVVGMVQFLANSSVCPKMIVVGIPNTDRTRDLTPTHVVGGLYMDSASSKTSGGGEAFMRFIEKELMPHIDSLYPTAPYKMLIGHSFGGLTAMNAFVHHNNLFNSYVAIDPSMWWDKQKLLKETQLALANNNYKGKALYLGIANTMLEGMDTGRVKLDTTDGTMHIRSILKLRDYLAQNKDKNGLKFSYNYYGNDNHGSVPMITEYDALHAIFDFYKLQIQNNHFFDSTFSMDSMLEEHYKNISAQFGYTVKPPEDMINELAYNFLQQKQLGKAGHLFALNVANYPESFNVYDSQGDFYAAKNDKPDAITCYKKALSIKENPDTKKKLDKLEDKK
jgi:predicted alpha/beta superfamily hydrolase